MRHRTEIHSLRENNLFTDAYEFEDDAMMLDDFEEDFSNEAEFADSHAVQSRRAIEDMMEEKRFHKELDYLEDFDFDEFDDLLDDHE